MARTTATRTSSSCNATLAVALLLMTLVGQSYAFDRNNRIVASLLRLQFHDCFVRGCDASILLDGRDSEKVASGNIGVGPYDLIDACKESVEQICPGVVSCADIIVIATRVAVFLAGGRWYRVEVGRRDGVISRASEAEANLPASSISVPNAIDVFRTRGLNTQDFVLLLGGGHTVGRIHCSFVMERLYNFQGSRGSDPTMNPTTFSSLSRTCPRSGSNNFVFADQTRGSEFKVDKAFYQAIRQGKGVLPIDQEIARHPRTASIVRRLSMTGDFTFEFPRAMVKLGRIGVLTDGSNAEKNAPSNGSVRGYELIDAIKTRLEQLCPGLVSCADIIVIATRAAVVLAQGNWYNVETGRKDGYFSSITEAEKNLPPPTISVSNAIKLFNSKGLSANDFVLLLGGGHTVGAIHCSKFLDRLYNYQNTGTADPSMNSNTLKSFQQRCPRSGSNNFVYTDQTVGSEFKVDNGFYKAISQGKGVLEIDQRIASDSLTKNSVSRLAWTGDFATQFGNAMINLGRVGVLTQGQSGGIVAVTISNNAFDMAICNII
uniref:peroxidase n=1 Tax=Chenopodium quinoa TaxID=63459 RepID=A0A803LD05_CHEQI